MAIERLAVVGRSVPRLDAREKVTGAARYVSDLAPPGMAHARVVAAVVADTEAVAEDLALPLGWVRVGQSELGMSPYEQATSASRSTTLMGLAVLAAARDLRDQLPGIGVGVLGAERGGLALRDGRIVGPAGELTFAEAVASRFGMAGGELIGRGTYRGERRPATLGGEAPFWEVGMAAAEVEAGMGIGHTFFEQMVYDGGQLLNPSLIDYRVPVMADVPAEYVSVLVENGDGPGPYGAKGIGESGLLPTAPAIANAIARATGVRLTDLPLVPERVWRAIVAAKGDTE